MNKHLFQTEIVAPANTTNNAGGKAYQMTDKAALAQFAATGCFNQTYYVSDDKQLETVLNLVKKVDPEFVGKVAVFARERSFMKDMPAFLAAYLTVAGPNVLERIFSRVIDNGKMLRNFVQIVRSGVVGRKSFGSLPKRLIQNWICNRDEGQYAWDMIGNDPSLADVIRMVHPHPRNPSQEAVFGYILGKRAVENVTNPKEEVSLALLPKNLAVYEMFKAGKSKEIPHVDFRLLDGYGADVWRHIAMRANWTMTRMNLNTFERKGLFSDNEVVQTIAARLRNPEEVRRARCFPYQLLTAFLNVSPNIPRVITDALQDAMEIATENVPAFDGIVYLCPDVSGSMGSPVTGYRTGATTKTRCVDVAGLITACVLRQNPNSEVLPFAGELKNERFNSRDSVMTNAEKIRRLNGGATNCAAPLRHLNERAAKGDLVIFVSDNESWMNGYAATYGRNYGGNKGTNMALEWKRFKDRNPNARLVCIDITPNATTQVMDDRSVLNVGGFSDNVFLSIKNFVDGGGHWVDEIERINFSYA